MNDEIVKYFGIILLGKPFTYVDENNEVRHAYEYEDKIYTFKRNLMCRNELEELPEEKK